MTEKGAPLRLTRISTTGYSDSEIWFDSYTNGLEGHCTVLYLALLSRQPSIRDNVRGRLHLDNHC